ncbi:MAG: DEAD/DEAH box helicase family protein [Salinivirgaceae bacterium]|nr:DEAD/DEAH box helicase family protein [Salinivirgaceae bacterium]
MQTVETTSFGVISRIESSNPRTPYQHQVEAFRNLGVINKNNKYSTLVVLPTGGGKTYTASTWLLKNAIDKKIKVLWLAHRTMLLDQALESFRKFAYLENLPSVPNFTYRVVSGAPHHDKTIHIEPTDNLLVISKDSIGRNLDRLDVWLENESRLFLVVDEAHHSTAKTYRRVIQYVREKVEDVKILGLTATPTRTSESEQGLLAKIFTDGVNSDGIAVNNELGIAYSVSLQDLINRRILSKPIQKIFYTEEKFTDLSLDEINNIMQLDVLPDSIADKMAGNANRNRFIVNKYFEDAELYGPTIVFATNIIHAISLCKLFNENGRIADYVVSSIKDSATGASISKEENERKIKEYQDGTLKVLVNVNILTEGVDLPQTKTVFLARPTTSTILMTQMIGRALRGPAAGGTEEAYIVSFVDDWNENIMWVNPETIFNGDNEFRETEYNNLTKNIRSIAISKIEEFAKILDSQVDTSELEKVDFMQRIPVGMYVFQYTTENEGDVQCQVIVYDNSMEAYATMLNDMPYLLEEYDLTDVEHPTDEILDELEARCFESYFNNYMIPPYRRSDVINIIRYFCQKDNAPKFYKFEQVDRSRLDIKKIAQHIYDQDMGARAQDEYLDNLWDSQDEEIIKLFFGRKAYFLKQVDVEILKIRRPDIYDQLDNNVKYGKRNLDELPLKQIEEVDPMYAKRLREGVYFAAKQPNGQYKCAICGRTSRVKSVFQVDHIKAMNNGGKSVPENLQLLCRKCNTIKSDKE